MKTKNDFFSLLKRFGKSGKSATVHISSQISIEPEKKSAEGVAHCASKDRNVADGAAAAGKAQIYNLIIVDESGSMHELRESTLSGINETINTIRCAQKEFAATQEHLLTLVTFDSRANAPMVRTIIDTKPIEDVSVFSNYAPFGCTPLYDAMGQSITALYDKIKDNKDATAVVTVLTDGLENSSHEWNAVTLRALIDKLKNEGWSFSYMGSAHNVKEVSNLLSIENVVEFSHDKHGAENTWERESASRREYYMKMNAVYEKGGFASDEERRSMKCRFAKEYYGNRVTPEHIEQLEYNEVFVFGSNANGFHNGGAAAYAMQHFGAQWGQCEGLQGHSYAIPTMEGYGRMAQAVECFTLYARQHPELRFLVTRIGCGIAGYTADEVAPLFKECVALENVALPQDFWTVLGLKMY
jgi:hypothetical protein